MVAQFRVRELDRETEVQTNFLHLFGDFSQPAISRQIGEIRSKCRRDIFRIVRQFKSHSLRQQSLILLI